MKYSQGMRMNGWTDGQTSAESSWIGHGGLGNIILEFEEYLKKFGELPQSRYTFWHVFYFIFDIFFYQERNTEEHWHEHHD